MRQRYTWIKNSFQLIAAFLLIFSCSFSQKSSTASTPGSTSDVSQPSGEELKNSDTTQSASLLFPEAYEKFESMFPELKLGEQSLNTGVGKLIPHEIASPFFAFENSSTEADSEQLAKEELYAVGKIKGSNGLDLLICDYEYIRPDEDTYDNHTDGIRYLLVFKNGQPLKKKDNNQEQIIYILNSHYFGEGGESHYQSYFDVDTTIITTQNSSESESATGFATPIVSMKTFRSKLNDEGVMEIKEITRLELSSPFYDENYLQKKWNEADDSMGGYPSKKRGWQLDLNGFFYYEPIPIFSRPVRLTFYNERINGELRAVFETFSDNTLIDRYITGQKNRSAPEKKDYLGRKDVLKCPVIIQTSDGKVELLPSGKLVLLK